MRKTNKAPVDQIGGAKGPYQIHLGTRKRGLRPPGGSVRHLKATHVAPYQVPGTGGERRRFTCSGNSLSESEVSSIPRGTAT